MLFNKNNKLTDNEIKKISYVKGNGQPYVEWLNEEYDKMNEEEKKEVDDIEEMLLRKFGINDENERNEK